MDVQKEVRRLLGLDEGQGRVHDLAGWRFPVMRNLRALGYLGGAGQDKEERH